MSGFIDIASDTSMGRITIWSTGECVLEAIDSNTENQKFYKNEQLKELNDLESLFNSFFNAIKDEVN